MQEEKILQLLETWMKYSNVTREEKIKYYQKLITFLQMDVENLKIEGMKKATSLGLIGFGTGLVFPKEEEYTLYLGILFIILGITVIVPTKKQEHDFEELTPIEEERKQIKKWYQEHKE
jgi:hypothetical protein